MFEKDNLKAVIFLGYLDDNQNTVQLYVCDLWTVVH